VIRPGFRTPLVDKQIPEQARELRIGEQEVIKNVMLKETSTVSSLPLPMSPRWPCCLPAFLPMRSPASLLSSATAGSCNDLG
jgi:hypothetical protein